ncbi:MAG: hypothetical protein JWM10_3086, partial [Myxococcaceae bacterium]|nr:hypothetical protein [Myxococcaceae bacterium]
PARVAALAAQRRALAEEIAAALGE